MKSPRKKSVGNCFTEEGFRPLKKETGGGPFIGASPGGVSQTSFPTVHFLKKKRGN